MAASFDGSFADPFTELLPQFRPPANCSDPLRWAQENLSYGCFVALGFHKIHPHVWETKEGRNNWYQSRQSSAMDGSSERMMASMDRSLGYMREIKEMMKSCLEQLKVISCSILQSTGEASKVDDGAAEPEAKETTITVAEDDGAKMVEALGESVFPVATPQQQAATKTTTPVIEMGAETLKLEEEASEPELKTNMEAEPVLIWGVPLAGDNERRDMGLLEYLCACEFKVKEARAMQNAARLRRMPFGTKTLLDADLGLSELEKVVFHRGTNWEGQSVGFNTYGDFHDKSPPDKRNSRRPPPHALPHSPVLQDLTRYPCLVEERQLFDEMLLHEMTCSMITGERQATCMRNLFLKTILRQEITFFDKSLKKAYASGVREGLAPSLGMGMVRLFRSCSLGIWYDAKLILQKWYTRPQVMNVISVLGGSLALGQASPSRKVFAGGQAAAYKKFKTINMKPAINVYSTTEKKLDNIQGDIECRFVYLAYPTRPDEHIGNAACEGCTKYVSLLLFPTDEEKATYVGKMVNGEKLTCPVHKCCICKLGKDKRFKELQVVVCQWCPKSYHRKCLPWDITFKKSVVSTIKEDCSTGHTILAASDLKELCYNEYYSYLVKKHVPMKIDRHDQEKELASVLLSSLCGEAISHAQIRQGFVLQLEAVDNLTVDTTDTVDVVAFFIARAVVDDTLPPAMISKNGDAAEVCRCTELAVPFFHHEIVNLELIRVMENPVAGSFLINLWKEASEECLFSSSQMMEGFPRLAESLDDLSLVNPSAKSQYQMLVTKANSDGWLDASDAGSGAHGDVNDEEYVKLRRYKEEALYIIHENFLSDGIPDLFCSLKELAAPEYHPIFIKKLMTLAWQTNKGRADGFSEILQINLDFSGGFQTHVQSDIVQRKLVLADQIKALWDRQEELYECKSVKLITNASDAVDQLHYLSVTEPDRLKDDPELDIGIQIDQDNGIITIMNTGLSMARQEPVESLGIIASTGTGKVGFTFSNILELWSLIHGKALYQLYNIRVREACKDLASLVPPRTQYEKELYCLLSGLHTGNLHKALETLGKSQIMRSQDISFQRRILDYGRIGGKPQSVGKGCLIEGEHGPNPGIQIFRVFAEFGGNC